MPGGTNGQSRLRSVLSFAAVPAVLSGVRHTVRAQLTQWGVPAVADEAELVVGELAANVVRHVGEGTFPTLVMELAGDILRVEVHDQSYQLPRLLTGGSDDVGGRGLRLVAGVAADWGTLLTSTGKAVWCEISADPEACSRQVRRAEAALTRYGADTGAPDMSRRLLQEELAVDLIADLLHWIHARGGDPDGLLDMAQMHFEAESGAEAA